MRHISTILLAAALVMTACSPCQKTPRSKHVIFLGFDAMSAIGIQRAETPNFNRMIANGAISLDTRCVRSTSSSQNWMSMVTGAPIEMHGVTENDWERDNYSIIPAAKNDDQIFPTMFDDIRAAKPNAKIHGFIEWAGETRMYDMTKFDKAVYSSKEKQYNADELLQMAFADYIAEQPDLLFVSIDITDHEGHSAGHESQEYFDCVHHMDELVGAFVDELEAKGMLDDAVIIITADHGGINFSHGGDTMEELQVPILMYGKGVTKGKVMEHANMIYDNAATVCGLLGVEMPRECRGRFLYEAFEPKTNVCYVPTPLVHPFKGVIEAGQTVSISCDIDGADVYYTLDGTVPTENSTKYEGPFELKEDATVQAKALKNGCWSGMASNFLYASAPEGAKAVSYKLYKNFQGVQLPDFTKFGRADAIGEVSAFTLYGLPVPASEDHFAVIFHSTLVIEKDGKYRFRLTSDDGAKLYIDNQLVVDNDGSHSQSSKFGNVDLKAGDHLIKVEYFDDTAGQSLEVQYAPEGQPTRPIFGKELKK